MTAVAPEPEVDAAAIERMLDDAPPIYRSGSTRARTSRWSPLILPDEPPAEERAARRRAARRVFRMYCVACGRSSEVSIVPARPSRCVHCDGTILVELVAY